MFTGIIECTGLVEEVIRHANSNVEFAIKAPFMDELILGQSIAHNGVCLTVTSIKEGSYYVTAIEETLKRTNLGSLLKGDKVNLERCMPANGRFDGHIVQGHVDTQATCEEIIVKDGSWEYRFSYPYQPDYVTVEKGSICVNGISLTVSMSEKDNFNVAIIPYTHVNTNIGQVQIGSRVNIEFDILGKYLYKISRNLT